MQFTTRPTTTAALLAALCVTTFGRHTLAQTSPPAVEVNAPKVLPSNQPAAKPEVPAETFDVNFAGGTLSQYVDSVRKAASAAGKIPVNVVVDASLAAMEVPKIELRDVTAVTAMRVVESMSKAEKGVQVFVRTDTPGTPLIRIIPIVPEKPRLYPSRPEPDASPSRLVLSLAPVIGAVADESKDERLNVVLSAVESTLRLGRPDSEPLPDLALHRDSNLLIMLGNNEDRETVRSVLTQMEVNRGGIGATSSKRAFQLLTAQAPDVVRAIREVIPEFRADPSLFHTITIESPNKLLIEAPYELLLKMAGIIAYVDQPAKVNPEVIQLNAQLESRQSAFREQLDTSRRREADLEAQLRELQAQLSAVNREAESADFKRKATEERNAELQKELAAAKARIQEFIFEMGGLRKTLEDERAKSKP